MLTAGQGRCGAKAAGSPMVTRRLRNVRWVVACCALAAAPLVRAAPSGQAPSGPALLTLSLLGHAIGTERSAITHEGDHSVLTSHFEYHDRGTPIALDTTLAYAKDFTPLSFESHGKSYRYFSVNDSVPHASGAPDTFALDGMAPLAAQGILLRYWLAHGHPPMLTLQPSGNRVHISEQPETRDVGGYGRPLRRFVLNGVVWGDETIWLDAGDFHVVAAATSAGVMPFEAADPRITDPLALSQIAITDGLKRMAAVMTPGLHAILPLRSSTFALTDARVIDGTGAAPIEHANVIVRNNRIERVGTADQAPVPRGMSVVDVAGTTILPGLWDSHAHVGQVDWGPVYLAAGVTSARDMGGEFAVVTALRDAWNNGRALGPHLLLAGLVDGPGPDAFGAVTAGTPEEARAVVARYKAANFQQMKVYQIMQRPQVAAVIEAAHASGMMVTGHVPTGLTLRDVVTLGYDHVAHLVVRGAPGSEELRDTIAFLQAHRTVMDPTISWNEMLGRSAQTPLIDIEPGLAHVAPVLRRLLESANGGTITPEQARQRLERSLAVIKALYEAGIPILVGTDKGVPGVSVDRGIELYVEAGIPPMDAIREATAIPAKAMGMADETGTLVPGLRADLIVVDGNPLEHISDIRNVTLVCTNGRLYATSQLWPVGNFRQ